MDTNTPQSHAEHAPEKGKYFWYRFHNGKAALPALFFLSFAEAIFFPIPPDVLLAPLAWSKRRENSKGCFSCIPNPVPWMIATLGSVLGGMIGFAIGMFFFDTLGTWILSTFHLTDAFRVVAEQFRTHAFIAVFAAGFTPIPYKVFTIGAGVFGISFPLFVFASIISRGMRFFIVSYVTERFGLLWAEKVPRMIAWITLGIFFVVGLFFMLK